MSDESGIPKGTDETAGAKVSYLKPLDGEVEMFQSYVSKSKRHNEREAGHWAPKVAVVARFVLVGIVVGVGLGFAFPEWLERHGVETAAPVAGQAAPGTKGAAMQWATLEARVGQWRADLGGESAGIGAGTEIEGRLKPLEDELIQVGTDQMKLDAEPGNTPDKQSRYESLEHRKDLLQLSYEGELNKLTPAEKEAAHKVFVEHEIQATEAYLDTLAPPTAGRGNAGAGGVTGEEDPWWIEGAVERRAVEGAAGGVVGGLCGLCVVLVRGRRRRIAEIEDGGDAASAAVAVEKTPVVVEDTPVAVEDTTVAAGDTVVAMEEAIVEESVPEAPAVRELGSMPRATVLDEGEDSPVGKKALEIGYAMLAEDWGRAWGEGVRSYAVTSADAGDGSAMVTAQVGLALSRIGLRVALVGGGSGLQEVFRVEAGAVQASRFARLGVVAWGENDDPLPALLERLGGEWDLVLIDAPSLGRMGGFGGGVVVVVRGGAYKGGEAALKRLGDGGFRIVGVVVME